MVRYWEVEREHGVSRIRGVIVGTLLGLSAWVALVIALI